MSLSSRVDLLVLLYTKPTQHVRLMFLNPGESLESSTCVDNANISSHEEKIIVIRFMKPSEPRSQNFNN